MTVRKNDVSSQWPACFTFSSLIGRSAAIANAIRIAKVAARSSAAVLVFGESGVGKELFAQSIHNASRRAAMPFVTINCGAIPRELIEAELFGYMPNSFTGASARGAAGKFSIANGGTLFLDEVADLSMEAQVKLLRAISSGEITRVGGASPEKVDVRIVCATNKDLQAEIESGNFREDLYYRLNVFEIRVPPLRERLEDIEAIVDYFIARSSAAIFGQGVPVVPSERFLAGLKKYHWPGNVRQLQAVLERELHHLAGKHHDGGAAPVLDHLPDSLRGGHDGRAGTPAELRIRPLVEVEEDMIRAALARYSWDFSKACSKLGISRATLYRKVGLYGIKRPGAGR